MSRSRLHFSIPAARVARLLAVVAAAALAVPSSTGADDRLVADDLAQSWRWRAYDEDPVLPAGTPSTIGTDSADAIYAATPRGLFRYNGYRWKRLPAAEGSDPYPIQRIVEGSGRVFALTPRAVWTLRHGVVMERAVEGGPFVIAAGPGSALFVIDTSRRVHQRFEGPGNRLRELDEVPLEMGTIHDYAIDSRRMHWLATSTGLYRRDLQRRYKWRRPVGLPPELRDLPVRRVTLLAHRPLARVGHAPLVYRRLPGPGVRYELWASFESAQGPVNARLVFDDDGEETEWTILPEPARSAPLAEVARDGTGNFYLIDTGGNLLFSSDGASWEAVKTLGIGEAKLRGVLVDQYGLVWFGFDFSMGVGGVAWFDPLSRRWERLAEEPELAKLKVLSLLRAADGTQWIGAVSGLYRLRNGSVRRLDSVDGTELRHITGLAEDARGNVWITSGESFAGAFQVAVGEDRPQRAHLLHSFNDASFNRAPILRVRSGRRRDLWFLSSERAPGGDGHRAYRLVSPRFGEDQLEPVDLPGGRVNDIIEAQDGTMWAATQTGLLRWTSPEQMQTYTARHGADPSEGLRSPRVWALAENPEDGSIWFCYADSGFGVSRFLDGRFTHHDERRGLASGKVWAVAATQTSFGTRIWVGTNAGLSCFDGDAWYNYGVASFDARSTPTIWTFYTTEDPGNEIQLGTLGQGAYFFRLQNPRRPRFFGLDIKQARRRSTSVTFTWEARDFKDQTPADELYYRFQVDSFPLSGFSKRRQVTIPDLEPGVEHRLQVEVRDRDGLSSHRPLVQTFQVEAPPLLSPMQRFGAILAAAIAAILLAIVAVSAIARWRQPLLRLRHVFAGAGYPAFLVDRNSRIVEYNGAHPEWLGLDDVTQRRLSGLPVRLVPAWSRGEIDTLCAEALAGRPAATELEVTRRNGGGRATLAVQATPVSLHGDAKRRSNGVLLQVDDVSETSRRVRDLRRRGRMEAVRALAQRLRDELHDAANGDDAARVKALCDELSRVAGGGEARDGEVAVHEMLERLLAPEAGGRADWPRRIEVDYRAQTGLWTVRGDGQQLELALGAVLQNAAEAMPEGGKLTVRAANHRHEGDEGLLAAGRYVQVVVADEGSGMDERQLEQVFDPLFTTKSTRRHRGVGMSVAAAIIATLDGDITVDSRPGEGSTVTVLLPAASH